MHDYVKLKNISAGSRITKLKAEIHMSGSLIVAFFICAIIEYFNKPSEHIILYGFIICILGAFFSNRHFCNRLKKSVQGYSFQLGFQLNEFDTFEKYLKEIKSIEAGNSTGIIIKFIKAISMIIWSFIKKILELLQAFVKWLVEKERKLVKNLQ